MIERAEGQSVLDASKLEVLEVWASINENMMTAEHYTTQLASASVIGVREDGEIRLYVHYWLIDDRVGLLYVETDPLSPANYAESRDEAVASVESMGFIVDSVRIRDMEPEDRQQKLAAMPAFGGAPAGEGDDGEAELEDIEMVDDDTASSIVDLEADPEDMDPETILILDADDSTTSSGPAGHAVSARFGGEVDPGMWKVFFRMIASL